MENLKKFYFNEIIRCLVKYGSINKEIAESMLINSPIYSSLSGDGDEVGMIDHESPYYWAMRILYSKERPDWYQDPKLWPPPKGEE